MSPGGPVTREQHDTVALVTLTRPDQLNALDEATVSALDAMVDELARDHATRCVVLTGAGKAFCAGADIKEFGAFPGSPEFRAMLDSGSAVLRKIELLPQPVVAAVNGFALGGGLELALACDLRVADALARFGVPEIKLGLLPGLGGTQRLPRTVPAGAATRMLMLGDPIDADEAHRIGLVDTIAPAGTVVAVALELATALAERAPLALAAAKLMLARGRDLPLEAALELERSTVASLFATEDRAEGVAAFLEKRRARFSGR
jgi:enoyl-CoA hydratase